MVKPINRIPAREIDKLTPADAAAARSYIAKNSANLSVDNIVVDEVIAYLANAVENRRARQVTKWEQMGGDQLQLTV